MTRVATGVFACLVLLISFGCTGGQETTASETVLPKEESLRVAPPAPVDGRDRIEAISPSIPVYSNAAFRDDLSSRDAVVIRNQYGPQADVLTLATEDSYPQVYHYYVTYLAQYRAWNPPFPYPPGNESLRMIQVPLNMAMQDPFIPGAAIQADRQVTLQIAEKETSPGTLIRYIITPQPVAGPVVIQ